MNELELIAQVRELEETVRLQKLQFKELSKVLLDPLNPLNVEWFERFIITDSDGQYITSRATSFQTDYRVNRMQLTRSKQLLEGMLSK